MADRWARLKEEHRRREEQAMLEMASEADRRAVVSMNAIMAERAWRVIAFIRERPRDEASAALDEVSRMLTELEESDDG